VGPLRVHVIKQKNQRAKKKNGKKAKLCYWRFYNASSHNRKEVTSAKLAFLRQRNETLSMK
jgi:hypothetical protein